MDYPAWTQTLSPDQPGPIIDPEPEPEPQPSRPFPVEALPEGVRRYVEAIAKIDRVPAALPAACVLGALSTAIGKGLQLKSLPGKQAKPNLYILIAAKSGTSKSEVYRRVLKPVLNWHQEQVDRWKSDVWPDLVAKQKLLNRKIRRLEGGGRGPASDTLADKMALKESVVELASIEVQLHAPKFVVENVTSEALAIALSRSGETLASLSSDARDIVDIISGRYRQKGGTDEPLYLKAFSWELYLMDRVGRPPLTILEACLTCLWLVQPDKLNHLLGIRGQADSGLLPRFLIAKLDMVRQPIDREMEDIDVALTSEWDRLIRDIFTAYRASDVRHIMEPTLEARDALDRQHDELVVRSNSDLQDVDSFAARWNEQAWRICCVLQAARYGADAHLHQVDIETARGAIAIADWFAEQQLDTLQAGRQLAVDDKESKVLELLADRPGGIVAADVYRKGIVTKAKEARELLKRMVAEGTITAIDKPTPGGGPTKRTYMLVGRCDQ